ncbi:MAG: acyltransferase [Candidatus Micrarchaeota archaeon]
MFEFDPLNFFLDFTIGILFLVTLGWALKNFPKREEPDPSEKQKRIKLFDVLKGIGIIAVILIHVNSPIPYFFLGSAVPIFILCSGYLLMKRYAYLFSYKKYFLNIFFRIIVPYFLIVVLLRILSSFPIDPINVFLDMVLGQMPYIHDSPSNYFIPLIIYMYLIFPFFLNFKRFFLNQKVLIAVFIFSLISCFVSDFFESHLYTTSIAYSLILTLPFRYLFFFLFGAYLSEYNFDSVAKRKKSVLVSAILLFILIGTSVFIYLSYKYAFFLFPPLILLLFLTSYRFGGIITDFLSEFGRHILTIYLIHWAVYALLRNNLPFIGGPLAFLVYALPVLLISYLFSVVFMRIYCPIKTAIRPIVDKFVRVDK